MKAKEKEAVLDGLKTVTDMLSDINVSGCAAETTEAVIAGVISRIDTLSDYVRGITVDDDDDGLRDFCIELCGKLYDHDMHGEEDRLRSLLGENA